MDPILWHFRLSHYNEKVRWALDWKGIPHERRALLPGLHVPRTLWLTRQTQVPILQIAGETIHDSSRIVERVERLRPEPPLYPRDPAERERALALEDFSDEELGPHVRRALFFDLLPDTAYAAELFAREDGPGLRAFYRAIFPGVRMIMNAAMQIDADRAEASRARTRAALDRLARELRPSGYLVGDGFTVADLTAAALVSPILAPPEYPYPRPGPYPAPAQQWCDSLAGHPAIRWAADMYRRHRGQSAERR